LPSSSPVTLKGRYALILPDGSVFADSSGANSRGVAFCVTCYAAAGDAADHLFLVPEGLRRSPPEQRPTR
jgi:hypothetical protein